MENDEIENIGSNHSDNRPFSDILGAGLSRRNVLRGGAVGAAAFFLGDAVVGSKASANGAASLGYEAIDTNAFDAVTVPDGYSTQVIAKWGDPINGQSPRFAKDASNPAAHQEEQLGQGHDGMHYYPLGENKDSNHRGLLAINHEYTLGQLTFPDGRDNWDAPKTKKEQAGHGVSVVEVVRKRNGDWQVVPSFRARRITPRTKVQITGPAAGHRLMRTADFPGGTITRGIVNQCGSAKTPWGTYLTTEENFNGYFWEESGGTAPAISAEQAAINARYGVRSRGFGYLWASTDDDWRADLNPNRPNTFGYMVEIDPYDPGKPAMKRTALGRFKHEGAAFLTTSTGQVAVYMGDDERFDYVYKFVSAKPWAEEIAAGRSPLDEGTLYVARFNEDGSGDWLPLVQGEGPLTPENGFADQGDVLIKARIAADLLGATPMDRPEWTTSNELTGEVFVTLTNNSRRTEEQVDAANPRGPNFFGHIIKWSEGGDAGNTTFVWEIFLLGGDADDMTDADGEDTFGSPDGLWLDQFGVLWIQTDGGQPDGSNNQMLACDPDTKEIKRFAVGPVDCEVTGITSTPDGTSLFFNIQHPGDGGSAENPTATSSWPDYDVDGRPRPATVVVTKDDGGRVGT
ncbi:MAG: PhoX family phosphatase [Ilumatobacter sp.]